jgi:hypothetical protein
MSVTYTRRVWREAPVGGRPLMVLLALADGADSKGEVSCTRHDLQHKTRLNALQVAGALEQLTTMKLLAMAPWDPAERMTFRLFPEPGWALTRRPPGPAPADAADVPF